MAKGMTTWKFRERLKGRQHVLARRWYLVVATILLLMPTLIAVHNATGVYYSTSTFLFLPPASSVEGGGNSLRADPGSTVYFAAVVEREFNQGSTADTVPRPTNAPLYATGIERGIAVYLPDQGGQWQTNFNKAEIRIEVVGASESEVLDNMNTTIAKLKQLSTQPQEKMKIWPESRITTESSPEVPAVGYAWIRNSRAEIAVAALMVGLSVAVANLGDIILTRISRRRQNSRDSESEAVRSPGHPDRQPTVHDLSA